MQDKPEVMEAPSHTVSSKDENVVKEPSNSLRIGKTLLTCATFVTFVSTLIYFLQFPRVNTVNQWYFVGCPGVLQGACLAGFQPTDGGELGNNFLPVYHQVGWIYWRCFPQ